MNVVEAFNKRTCSVVLAIITAWLCAVGAVNAQVYSCNCQGGGDITETKTLCIAGNYYSATITRCERWANNLTDPCLQNYRPDVVTYFKKICLDSTVNFTIDDVLKAVLCVYDPCLGNALGASVQLAVRIQTMCSVGLTASRSVGLAIVQGATAFVALLINAAGDIVGIALIHQLACVASYLGFPNNSFVAPQVIVRQVVLYQQTARQNQRAHPVNSLIVDSRCIAMYPHCAARL